jgi:glucosamine--fructose-6-phosphate aminotransferase (isomerizing)
MNAYQTDIFAQPTALRNTLEYLDTTDIPSLIKDSLREGKWNRIILTGMGSSYFALLPLQLRLLEAGLPAWLVETSELIYSHAYLTRDTLMVVASQSGSSVETIKLMEKIGSEITVIGLTNTIESPLARKAAYSVITRAGEESSVSCKTYLSALAAQVWLGDQLIEGVKEFVNLQWLPQSVERYLSTWEQYMTELKQAIDGSRNFYLTGRGISIASAGTGGLILKEAVHIAAEGMSSAAFRHGPFEMTGPETFVLVFAGCGPLAPLNKKLAKDIASANGRAALVEISENLSVFSLPKIPNAVLPILEILPIQMMTLALAEMHNIQAGIFHLATKITKIE